MDSYRGFDEDASWAATAEDEPAIERPPEIGVDERRMHVRAYNYWVSLLGGRSYPSVEDLQPERIGDFGPHSVLLDFTGNADDPSIAYLGPALRDECQLDSGVTHISQVPSRSLLSRLTDHYLQIIANRAPIGFEAEFVSDRGVNTLYRGILMPLSTDGETIDFIYGVINWKQMIDSAATAELASQVDRALSAAPASGGLPVWADGPNAELEEAEPEPHVIADDRTLSLLPAEKAESDELDALPEDAGLADRLEQARQGAEIARGADHRSRAALYRALGLAHDFALVADARPDEYEELLDDAGLKVQARAPMTAIVKLVFGIDYDKGRLTEFAAALSWAQRTGLGTGTLCAALEACKGGLKAIVAEERAARRPAAKPDRTAVRREALRHAAPIATLSDMIDGPAGEFVLLVARTEGDGRVAIVAPALTDPRLIEAAIGKAAIQN